MSIFNTYQFCLSALWQQSDEGDANKDNSTTVGLIEDIQLNYCFHVGIARVLQGAPKLNLMYSLHM